jgi:hypothetical protein
VSEAKKRGIYFGEALQRLVDERADAAGGLRSASGVVNAVADRYLEIVRRSCPVLSVPEWSLIFDSLNGVWAQDSAALYVGALAHGISDSIALDRLDQKWGVDGAALLRALNDCTFCQLVAVVDAAERFWAASDRSGDVRDQVAAIVGPAGVRV